MEPIDRLFDEYVKAKRKWLDIGTPWVTIAAQQWLEKNICPTDVVMEYGAGRSTIFFARKARKVFSAEGSPDWMAWVLLYLYEHPELLKKVRFLFSPADWNPTYQSGKKRYWTENDELTDGDVSEMENDLAGFWMPQSNVILFDGNVRPLVFKTICRSIDFHNVDIMIVDNTEGPVTDAATRDLIPAYFVRLDCVAGPKDIVPVHQKGKHVTSIFVKARRLKDEDKQYIIGIDAFRKHQIGGG